MSNAEPGTSHQSTWNRALRHPGRSSRSPSSPDRTTTATPSRRSRASAPTRAVSGTPRPSFPPARQPSSSPVGSPTATTCAAARSPASRRSWSRSSGSPPTAGSCSASATASRSSPRRACFRARSARTSRSRSSAATSASRSTAPTARSRPAAREGQTLTIPVKHGDGCWFADPETVAELDAAGQLLLRYGPGENPNGAVADVAGVCNEAGNVFGLMPHPEHAVDPLLGSTDGALILGSLVDAARLSAAAPV